MSIAYEYIMSKLDSALSDAESWAVCEWGNNHVFLAQVQGSARHSVAMGKEMFAFLDKVPYTTSRLAKPGVAALAILDFDSVPEQNHHRASIAVYSALQVSLRSHVMNIQPDGTGISPQLQFEINEWNEISCDDTIDEGPHSIFNRIIAAARGGHFAWQAATLRLNQNLADAMELPQATDSDPQDMWNRYTSILQVRRRALNTPLRCTRKTFEDHMYRLITLENFLNADDDDSDSDSDDSDDMDAPAGSRRPPKNPSASIRWISIFA